MCEKCKAIDEKISKYRRLADQLADSQASAGIKGLIARLEADKAAFDCALLKKQ